MKKVFLLLFAVSLLLLCGCATNMTEDNSENLTAKEDSHKELLVEIIMDHINSWESVSDNYTQKNTYDEIYASQIDVYTKGIIGEYYFVASYVINDSVKGSSSYYKFFYVTEQDFQFLNSSQEPLIPASEIFSTDYVMLGLETINANTDIGDAVDKLIQKSILKEKNYYNELNSLDNNQIELNDKEAKLFNKIYNAVNDLEYYEFSDYKIQLPLTKIQFYVLNNGECRALLWYNFTREKGYLIFEEGYKELSDEKVEVLLNTSSKISLDWNVKWSTEKKEYALKKAIASK